MFKSGLASVPSFIFWSRFFGRFNYLFCECLEEFICKAIWVWYFVGEILNLWFNQNYEIIHIFHFFWVRFPHSHSLSSSMSLNFFFIYSISLGYVSELISSLILSFFFFFKGNFDKRSFNGMSLNWLIWVDAVTSKEAMESSTITQYGTFVMKGAEK